jgi:AraC-like DNA-binding protein
MATPIPDVPFPLMGGSTAAVTDRLRMRLLSWSGTLITEKWGSRDFTAPYWRMYLNLDDGAVARVGAVTTALRAGHLYVIPAWLAWAGSCRGRVRHLNASIDLPSLPRERVAAQCTRVFHLGGPDTALAGDWLRLGSELAAATRPDPAQVARAYALSYQGLAAVFAQIGPAADGLLAAPGEALLADVIAAIEHHLGSPLPVAARARPAGCSPPELVRRFRAVYGTSPARWVRQRRVMVAADQLRCTDDAIDVIAERCGFTDRSRFSKCFSALIGCGPATWRRRERGR